MKKFYLFQESGVTERFFCGNIYENLPADEIKCYGQLLTFKDCSELGMCREFNSKKEVNEHSRMEEKSMEHSNNYANQAMRNEEIYGCAGVDY